MRVKNLDVVAEGDAVKVKIYIYNNKTDIFHIYVKIRRRSIVQHFYEASQGDVVDETVEGLVSFEAFYEKCPLE